ncbi:3501_t:CDS:2, partial [Entrophospora sp. SA101]
FNSLLAELYPSGYTFKERELRAWRAMLKAASCHNYQFWSCSLNTLQDQQTLSQLYSQGFLSPTPIHKKTPIDEEHISKKFWECFGEALNKNKKEQDGCIRVLSIIANKFTYAELQKSFV